MPVSTQHAPKIDSAEVVRLMDAARDAVREAAMVIRACRDRIAAQGSFSKSDATPVTIADMTGQAIVNRALRRRLGDVVMVGEETSGPLRDDPAAVGLALELVRAGWPDAKADELLDMIDAGRRQPGTSIASGFWTLDPIDGTKGFLRTPNGHYCVALAFVVGSTPVAGAMACPTISVSAKDPFDGPGARGTLISAGLGQGAFEEPIDGGARVPCRSAAWNGGEVRTALSDDPTYAMLDRALPVIRQAGAEPSIQRLDSQSKYALVARGQADLFMRLPRLKPGNNYIWDHAAGAIIASESGCKVTDTTGRELDFSSGYTLPNEGFLIATPPLHAKLLQVLATGQH
jgi:3'(2'), 5'-bisphosphate nucleotidase